MSFIPHGGLSPASFPPPTLRRRRAPQQEVPLQPHGRAAVHGDQAVAPRPDQAAEDPLLLQRPRPGGPQGFTKRLQLPAAATAGLPRHQSQHGVDVLRPLLYLHLLRPFQLPHQVLDEYVLQRDAFRARPILQETISCFLLKNFSEKILLERFSVHNC